jgi:hypothetical protein
LFYSVPARATPANDHTQAELSTASRLALHRIASATGCS